MPRGDKSAYTDKTKSDKPNILKKGMKNAAYPGRKPSAAPGQPKIKSPMAVAKAARAELRHIRARRTKVPAPGLAPANHFI